MKEVTWYEVWVDDCLSPPYVLLLLCFEGDGGFQVYDPTERRVVHMDLTYESTRNWLLEDEYRQVRGRMEIE